jgi:hypothetical protein
MFGFEMFFLKMNLLKIAIVVRAVGVEPTLCQPELDFESSASTCSATPACEPSSQTSCPALSRVSRRQP